MTSIWNSLSVCSLFVRCSLVALLLLPGPAEAQAAQDDAALDLYLDDFDGTPTQAESEALPQSEVEGVVAGVPIVDGLRPEASRIYTGEVLRQRGYRTLGEALVDIVGVFRRQTLSGPRYGMRGIADGLALEVDGVPQVVDGERDILNVDRGLSLLDVEQVEVVRGPVSAISGAGALSGIIRVKTTRPGLSGARVSTTISAVDVGIPAAVGDVDLTKGERQVEARAQHRFDNIGVFGAFSYRQGIRRMYRLDAVPLSFVTVGNAILPGAKGNREVAGRPEQALLARAGISADAAFFGAFFFDVSYANFETKMPVSRLSHGLIANGGDTVVRERTQLRAFWTATFGPTRLAISGWAARHMRDEDLSLFPAAGVFPLGGSTQIESDVDTGGVQARFDLALTENHRVRAVGLFDLTQQTATVNSIHPISGAVNLGVVTYDDLQATTSGAVEYQGDFDFGIRLTAGGVVRWRTGYPVAFLPRVALSYSPLPALSVRVAYAEGSQTPDRYDLAALSQALLVGEALGARENAQLQSEHSRNIEVGVTLRPSARLRVGADIFGLRHENAIESARDGIAIFPLNLEPRHLVGGEIYAEVDAVPNFLQIWTSVYHAVVVDGPLLDGNLARLLVAAEVTPIDAMRAGFRGRLLYRPHYEDAAALSQRSNASAGTSAVLDLYATVRPFDDHLSLQFVLSNLFDAAEVWETSTTSFANTSLALPSPGRTAWVRVEGRL